MAEKIQKNIDEDFESIDIWLSNWLLNQEE